MDSEKIYEVIKNDCILGSSDYYEKIPGNGFVQLSGVLIFKMFRPDVRQSDLSSGANFDPFRGSKTFDETTK